MVAHLSTYRLATSEIADKGQHTMSLHTMDLRLTNRNPFYKKHSYEHLCGTSLTSTVGYITHLNDLMCIEPKTTLVWLNSILHLHYILVCHLNTFTACTFPIIRQKIRSIISHQGIQFVVSIHLS